MRSPAVSTGATDTAGPGALAPLSSAKALSDPMRGRALARSGGTAALALSGGRIVSMRARIAGRGGAFCTNPGGPGTAGRKVGTERPPGGGGGRDDFFGGT